MDFFFRIMEEILYLMTLILSTKDAFRVCFCNFKVSVHEHNNVLKLKRERNGE